MRVFSPGEIKRFLERVVSSVKLGHYPEAGKTGDTGVAVLERELGQLALHTKVELQREIDWFERIRTLPSGGRIKLAEMTPSLK